MPAATMITAMICAARLFVERLIMILLLYLRATLRTPISRAAFIMMPVLLGVRALFIK